MSHGQPKKGEPELHDMMQDPIVVMLMNSDGVKKDPLLELLERKKAELAGMRSSSNVISC